MPSVVTRIEGLDTPVATVDLDAVDRNIARMQSYCDEHGLALRPHIKTHKLPTLAHAQVDAGAVGICCQKLGEVEVMAAAGLRDIFVPYPIVGAAKAARLARLAQETKLAVAGDSEVMARGLSPALGRAGVEVDFFVDCDTGFGRTGVQSPQEAAELAELADSLPGLRFAGLMVYPTSAESVPWLRAAREECGRRGLEVGRVSGGGTPGAFRTHELGEVDEIRVGTYVYGDRSCLGAGVTSLEDCALHVRTTVVSRPTPERAILDAGSKTLTSDPVAWTGGEGFGLILEYPDAVIYGLSEEHGHVDVSACATAPAIGDVVTIVPNHACACVNLHDTVAVHRAGVLAGVWPVAARGRLQ